MKTCPHCDSMMEEQAGSGGEMLKIPQQLADDQPPPMRVNRVRWRCPKCSDVEEGLPVAHGAWDKSDHKPRAHQRFRDNGSAARKS
jgi:hypothetical protein